ncbi:hypothetical protein ES705_15387 [subsurface metagenome]
MRSDFQKQLELVHQLGLQAVQQIDINLAIEVIDQEYNLSGNFFYIKDAPAPEMYVDVKCNSSGQPAVGWTKQTGFRHPFDRLYITTPAGQAGIMKILIASESPSLFEIIDNRSAISETMESVFDELRGDLTPENWGESIEVDNVIPTQLLAANPDRKGLLIQSQVEGIIYLGFDDTVSDSKYFRILVSVAVMGYIDNELRMNNYRGPIFGLAEGGSLLAYASEW